MCQVKKLKLHVRCNSPDDPTCVIIQKGDEQIGVCEKCWKRIAEKDWEIGSAPRPILSELLSDNARFGENPIETEYKFRGKKDEESPTEEEESD
jgi:hypothetical protein